MLLIRNYYSIKNISLSKLPWAFKKAQSPSLLIIPLVEWEEMMGKPGI